MTQIGSKDVFVALYVSAAPLDDAKNEGKLFIFPLSVTVNECSALKNRYCNS